EQADRADIVITSTGAPQQLFGRSHGQHFLQRRRNRPMFFIDIAVPRDVDQRLQSLDAVPAIKALQQNAEAIREAELARAAKHLADLTPEQHEAVEALTRSLTAKLLHPQLTALRKSTLKD